MNPSASDPRRSSIALLAPLLLGLCCLPATCTQRLEGLLSQPTITEQATALPTIQPWADAVRLGPQDMNVSGVAWDEASVPVTLVGFHTYEALPAVPITVNYHMLNRTLDAHTRRIFLLLDEHQLRGGIGDDPNALYTDVEVEKAQELTLTMTLPPLEPGPHNIVTISLPDPDADVIPGFDSSRGTLVATGGGGGDWREYQQMQDSALPRGFPFGITGDTSDPPVFSLWESEECSPGEVVEYAIYVGYRIQHPGLARELTGDDTYRFAVVAFLDFEQIPVEYGAAELPFYGAVERGEVGRLITAFQAPEEPGPHHLLVLLIQSPGAVMGEIVRGPHEPEPSVILPWLIDASGLHMTVQ
jgi:hypothetical protein